MALIIEKLIFSCVIKSLTLQFAICNTMKWPPNIKHYLNKPYLKQCLFKIFKLKLSSNSKNQIAPLITIIIT